MMDLCELACQCRWVETFHLRDSSSVWAVMSCYEWQPPRSSPWQTHVKTHVGAAHLGKFSGALSARASGTWGTWCCHLAEWEMPCLLWLELKEIASPSGGWVEPTDSLFWKLATGWTILTFNNSWGSALGHLPATRDPSHILSHIII